MDPMIITIIVAVGILSVLGGLVWWFLTKNTYKFLFKLTSRDGRVERTVKAKMINDPDNKRIKKFQFKDNPTLLPVREPDAHFNGKAMRRITYNVEGEYVYLKGYKVNEDNYIKSSLEPTPKALALYQMQANQRRNPIVDKAQTFAFISSIIMLILVLGATVYLSYTFAKTSENMVLLSQENKQVSIEARQYSELMLESNKIFLQATGMLSGYCGELSQVGFSGINVSRTLDPQVTG